MVPKEISFATEEVPAAVDVLFSLGLVLSILSGTLSDLTSTLAEGLLLYCLARSSKLAVDERGVNPDPAMDPNKDERPESPKLREPKALKELEGEGLVMFSAAVADTDSDVRGDMS